MKGIIFAGDSFTWGEGLHFYSDLPDIDYSAFSFNNLYYTPAHRDWINSNRFSRRVANHFETFDLVRYTNGGDNSEILDFIDNIETQYQRKYVDAQNSTHRMFTYTFNDFDYIVIQLTDIFRERILLPNGELCNIRSTTSRRATGFVEYLKNNFDNKIDNFILYYLEKFSKELESKIKKYESLGIKKCYVITWHNDILSFIKNNLFLNERLITFNLGDKIVESIWDLQGLDQQKVKYPQMSINKDPYFLEKNIVVTNTHTSLTAHKLMANEIIKKIEQNEQTRIHTI